jgi:ABC-type lipoprotein release transport system permease subunit
MIVSLSYRERIYEEIRTAYVYEYSIAKADYEKNHAEWKRRERLHMARNEYAEAAIKARNRMLFLESEAMQSGLFIGVSFRDEAA